MPQTPEERRAAARAKDRAYSRAYHAAHKAEISAKKRAYRAAHKEEIHAYAAAHYVVHKDALNAKHRAYRAAHKEEIHAKNRAHRVAHKEAINAHNRTKAAAHPERNATYLARRRARKAGSPRNDLTAAQWREIQAAYGYRCVYCPLTCPECHRQAHELTRDHIVPLAKGGAHTASNIVPACVPCNSRKHVGPPLCPVQPLLLTLAPPQKPGRL